MLLRFPALCGASVFRSGLSANFVAADIVALVVLVGRLLLLVLLVLLLIRRCRRSLRCGILFALLYENELLEMPSKIDEEATGGTTDKFNTTTANPATKLGLASGTGRPQHLPSALGGKQVSRHPTKTRRTERRGGGHLLVIHSPPRRLPCGAMHGLVA